MIARRKVLALLGMSSVSGPLAAKAALDAATAGAIGMFTTGLSGLGDASLQMPHTGGVPAETSEVYIPYEKRIIGASDFIKLAGNIPDVIERGLRDQSKTVLQLDPDIASKRSWSMNVKIAEQRQRNYQRSITRIHESASRQRKLAIIKELLGFEWPF